MFARCGFLGQQGVDLLVPCGVCCRWRRYAVPIVVSWTGWPSRPRESRHGHQEQRQGAGQLAEVEVAIRARRTKVGAASTARAPRPAVFGRGVAFVGACRAKFGHMGASGFVGETGWSGPRPLSWSGVRAQVWGGRIVGARSAMRAADRGGLASASAREWIGWVIRVTVRFSGTWPGWLMQRRRLGDPA